MNSNKMSKKVVDISQCQAAGIAGFMFLFSFIVPTLNWAFVLSKFIVPDNIIATANNIITNELLFRIGISIELVMSIGLVVLGLALYIILKPVNKDFALLGLLWKLLEATLAAVIVLISFIALQMVNEVPSLPGFTLEQVHSLIGFVLNIHTTIYAIPMVFLGLDMMIFSYLFLKSEYIPKLLASFGILSFALIFVYSLLFILAPKYATMPINQIIFWTPSGLFEIIIGTWLLSKGIRVNR